MRTFRIAALDSPRSRRSTRPGRGAGVAQVAVVVAAVPGQSTDVKAPSIGDGEQDEGVDVEADDPQGAQGLRQFGEEVGPIGQGSPPSTMLQRSSRTRRAVAVSRKTSNAFAWICTSSRHSRRNLAALGVSAWSRSVSWTLPPSIVSYRRLVQAAKNAARVAASPKTKIRLSEVRWVAT
jgi:hypothetical protein